MFCISIYDNHCIFKMSLVFNLILYYKDSSKYVLWLQLGLIDLLMIITIIEVFYNILVYIIDTQKYSESVDTQKYSVWDGITMDFVVIICLLDWQRCL